MSVGLTGQDTINRPVRNPYGHKGYLIIIRDEIHWERCCGEPWAGTARVGVTGQEGVPAELFGVCLFLTCCIHPAASHAVRLRGIQEKSRLLLFEGSLRKHPVGLQCMKQA